MVIFPFMQGEGPLLSAGGELGLHPVVTTLADERLFDPVRAYVSKQGRGPFSVISSLLEVSLPTFHSVLKGHPILWSRDCKVMGNHQKSALVRPLSTHSANRSRCWFKVPSVSRRTLLDASHTLHEDVSKLLCLSG